MAKQSKEEYKVARRKSYVSNRRALDPKLDRQLKDIEDQHKRRVIKNRKKWINWTLPKLQDAESDAFIEAERKRRTAKALAKSNARRKK